MQSKKHFPSPEAAVLALDKAFLSPVHSDVFDVMYGNETYDIVVLKSNIARMGADIFQRTENVFIEKKSEQGLDTEELIITRKALMLDGVECRESFIVRLSEQGWQVVKRDSINLIKPYGSFGDMTYDGYSWNLAHFVPCLNANIQIQLIADHSADERGPSEAQLDMLLKLTKSKNKLIPQIAEKTYEYIKAVFENWLGEDWDDLSEEDIFEVMDFTFIKPLSPKQSLQTIQRPFYISINEDIYPKQSVQFCFDVECTADLGHGLSFLIKDWEVVNFGPTGSF